jgi:hypothetical protein
MDARLHDEKRYQQMKFDGEFDSYVLYGEYLEVEIEGFTVRARIEFDEDHHINDDDTHNPDREVTGCNDEQHARMMAARQAWFDNKWFYCGIVLSVSIKGIMLDNYAASLWGIEANYPIPNSNTYLTQVANELLPEAVQVGKEILARIQQVAWPPSKAKYSTRLHDEIVVQPHKQ